MIQYVSRTNVLPSTANKIHSQHKSLYQQSPQQQSPYQQSQHLILGRLIMSEVLLKVTSYFQQTSYLHLQFIIDRNHKGQLLASPHDFCLLQNVNANQTITTFSTIHSYILKLISNIILQLSMRFKIKLRMAPAYGYTSTLIFPL